MQISKFYQSQKFAREQIKDDYFLKIELYFTNIFIKTIAKLHLTLINIKSFINYKEKFNFNWCFLGAKFIEAIK